MSLASWFLALPLLLLIILFGWLRWRKPVGAGLRYSDVGLVVRAVPSWGRWREWLLWLVRVTVLLLAVIAIARPQSEKRGEEVETEGIDIMITLDVSGSMRAEDFHPYNRLHVAKEVIRQFIQGLKTDRVGLVVFAAESFTQCPLTLDYDILLNLLDQVDFGILKDGTAIGMGIINALNRLKNSAAKSKVIILLTDGVNNAGRIDPITAAEASKALGVKIYTIGIGRRDGGPLPLNDPFWGRPLPSLSKAPVAEFDEDVLKQVAKITGGAYYHATDKTTLTNVYKNIWRLEKTRFRVKQYRQLTELFPYLLMPGIWLLFFETFLTNVALRKFP